MQLNRSKSDARLRLALFTPKSEQRFVDWLTKAVEENPNQIVGRQRSPCNCPVYNYAKNATGIHIDTVGRIEISWRPSRRHKTFQHRTMSIWARKFVAYIDKYFTPKDNTEITAREALDAYHTSSSMPWRYDINGEAHRDVSGYVP